MAILPRRLHRKRLQKMKKLKKDMSVGEFYGCALMLLDAHLTSLMCDNPKEGSKHATGLSFECTPLSS